MKLALFSNRFRLLLALLIAFGSLLIIRLVDLQLIRGAYFFQLANDNRFYTLPIPAERGVFLDRYGDPLVFNQRFYYQLHDGQLINSQRQAVSRDQALEIMANQEAEVAYELQRYYLYPRSLAHALGYTGAVNKDNLLADNLLQVNSQIGKIGLEKTYDEILRGTDGEALYEIDALNRKQRLVKLKPAKPGKNLDTTLDPYLSEVALSSLANNSGAVLIADAETGEILALVNSPTFDLNDLSQKLVDEEADQQRQDRVRGYFTDERQLFFNRAVSGAYAPGSVFKLVTAMAGLESRAIDASTQVVDEGVLKVGDFEYANWYYSQYGQTEGAIALVKAIARSNDIFFYKTAEWIGPDQLAEYARMFGLGKATGIESGMEAVGLIPDPEWKEQVIGERWFLGNTYHFGIGQGDVLVSPLQLLAMTQAISSQGKWCRPTLLQHQTDRCLNIGLQEPYFGLVTKGMIAACTSGGTAYPLFDYNGFLVDQDLNEINSNEALRRGAIACKTGTAEFGSTNERGYRKTHGWLVAIVGLDKARLNLDQVAQSDSDQPLPIPAQPLAPSLSATDAATTAISSNLATESARLSHDYWLGKVKQHGLPDRLIMVALVESDEAEPFKEGSQHAAPVIKQIVDWIYQGE